MKSKETKLYKAVQNCLAAKLNKAPKKGCIYADPLEGLPHRLVMHDVIAIYLRSRGTKLYKEEQIVQKLCKISTKTIRRDSDW